MLLKKNNISFDKNELEFQIQSHPSYPSMHAITDVLDHFNIDNIAAIVPVDSSVLDQLPNCFMAQLKEQTEKDIVCVKKDKLKYQIYYSKTKTDKLSESEFLNFFTGIILVVDKKDENISRVKGKIALMGKLFYLVAALFSIHFVYNQVTFTSTFYLVLSFLGILISAAILKQDLGLNSSIGNAFCSAGNEKTDCNAVLYSKGSVLFNKFKLSDISFTYFLGLLFSVYLISIQNLSLNILFSISLLGIPVVLFSLYYQYKVVKKWCFLCLTVALVLSFQASFFFFTDDSGIFWSLNNFLTLAFSYTAAFFVLNFVKDNYSTTIEAKKTRLEYQKFKRNYKIFSKLLSSSTKILTKPDNIPEIIFGNKNSEFEIIVITNPFCGHCSPVHKTIEDILLRYKEEVKIIIRFNVQADVNDSNATRISARLIEIYYAQGKDDCLLAMKQIYEGESVQNWFHTWAYCEDEEKYVSILKAEKDWCVRNGINFTPEILINKKPYPKEYKREDLIFFIEDLHDEIYSTKELVS